MRVPAVGPEEEQPVEQRLDVGHVGLPLWKDPEDAAVLLINNNNTKISWLQRYWHKPGRDEIRATTSRSTPLLLSLSLLFHVGCRDIITWCATFTFTESVDTFKSALISSPDFITSGRVRRFTSIPSQCALHKLFPGQTGSLTIWQSQRQQKTNSIS